MIETVHVHVCLVCVFVRIEWQGDVCHYNGRIAPPWLLAICSQAPAFQMDFRRLLFYHISSMSTALIVPPLSFSYHLISVLDALNQQNGAC